MGAGRPYFVGKGQPFMTLSVKFFKRLFLLILILLLVIPWVLFGMAKADQMKLQEDIAANQEELTKTRNELNKAKEELSWLQANPSAQPADPQAPTLSYQTMFPDLYCTPDHEDGWIRPENTVYLTFNDGPSDNTDAILNILAQNNVKATFFVTGKTDEASRERMKNIVNEGHSIGIYTYSRQYREIYGSVSAYLEDFEKMYALISETTGVKPEIFRFAGGSINGYNKLIYQPLIAEMTRRGFTYYDWDVASGDNVQGIDAASVQNNVAQGMAGKERAVLLLHDGTEYTVTVEALPGIIADLKDKGYEFAPLSSNVAPIIFSYDNIP